MEKIQEKNTKVVVQRNMMKRLKIYIDNDITFFFSNTSMISALFHASGAGLQSCFSRGVFVSLKVDFCKKYSLAIMQCRH